MSKRTTIAELREQLAVLNRMTDNGGFALDQSYGGVKLVTIDEEGGRSYVSVRMTKPQLSDTIYAIINTLSHVTRITHTKNKASSS